MVMAQRTAPGVQEAYEIGLEAFIYFYPLVTMDVTRRQMTNIEAGRRPGFGPMNTIAHVRAYPPIDMRAVVRPNFDTLYSVGWFDLTGEPLILSVPDTAGRYYLLPLYDMWTDAFASPGKRTSGTGAGHFAIVPPGWRGELPAGVTRIDASTPYVWMIGRTQTDGPRDYEAARKVQDGYAITPLSRWGREPLPGTFKVDPTVDMTTPPLDQVNKMRARAYFTYAAELMKLHPPHLTDWSILARMRHIGLDPGRSLAFDKLDTPLKQALHRAAADGLQLMREKMPTLARVANGWQMNTDTMGVYGNYYLKRAIVALAGLGANQPDDAIYPLLLADADGQPLNGEHNYVMHFTREELPPVGAFWSITMYDAEGFQAANPIDRFAIGDRDALRYNADGSLDIYMQRASPGPGKESNWLPAPPGALGVTMRLYAPQLQALDGRWVPPAVKKA